MQRCTNSVLQHEFLAHLVCLEGVYHGDASAAAGLQQLLRPRHARLCTHDTRLIHRTATNSSKAGLSTEMRLNWRARPFEFSSSSMLAGAECRQRSGMVPGEELRQEQKFEDSGLNFDLEQLDVVAQGIAKATWKEEVTLEVDHDQRRLPHLHQRGALHVKVKPQGCDLVQHFKP